jgi:glycosyltransferase involved in cell wall biosynthesis
LQKSSVIESQHLYRQPLVSILLIAYHQAGTVGEAIEGALAQTYSPLEIFLSDDASDDDTWAQIQAAVAGYQGPHTVRLNRNPVNLGIGAHLSRLVQMSAGELLFVAAGDDVSLPQRCETVVAAWLASDCKLDLIASALVDIDDSGALQGEIMPSPLQDWRTLEDWAAQPPHVVGAAQAWTRRVFDRFGPLPPGTVAEDLIMVFRAIASGGALTLREPLVRYRRGGISRRVRNMHAHDVVNRLLKNNRHALVETEQLLRDATLVGASVAVCNQLDAKLARERFVAELFAQRSLVGRVRSALRARMVPRAARLRLWLYASAPWVFAPFFALRRLAARER